MRSVVENAHGERAKYTRRNAAPVSPKPWAAPALKTWKREAAALSGGWQKRLAIVEALVQAPDILLLDEPTNHLDLAGIEWLEGLLERSRIRQRDRQPRPLLSGERSHGDG